MPPYRALTAKSQIDKAINSLLGIIEGIAIDGNVNQQEISYLTRWVNDQHEYRDRHPFTEIIPMIEEGIRDGVLTTEELADLTWLCEKLRSTQYHSTATADIQRLHAIMGAIAADGQVTIEELTGLSDWLADHDHLRTCWPYDEVDSILTTVLAEKHIDEEANSLLLTFFNDFAGNNDNKVVTQIPEQIEPVTLQGVAAVSPAIKFKDSAFCFTGESKKLTRKELNEIVLKLGGKVTESVTTKTNYLIVGANGNPCWAYSCYGRKVEAAVKLRRQGVRLVIVYENDFHDAAADNGI